MPQAIIVTYHGPTYARGSRLFARCDAGRLSIPYPSEANAGEDAHRIAAEALRDRLGWRGHLIGGGLPDGRWVFVFGVEGCDRPAYAIDTPNRPTFYLLTNTCGLVSRDHAARVAREVLGADYSGSVHAEPVSL